MVCEALRHVALHVDFLIPVVEGLTDTARHVIGWHVTQETGVQNAFDDVASNIRQSLPA